MDVTFRLAEEKDTALLLNFIRALAEYEHMLDLVVADEALLSDWLFERKVAEAFFAIADGVEVGFALYFHNFSTFLGRGGIYLEDLFVLPEQREKGYGKAILRHLAQIARARGCGRLEWACLNWNQPSIDFYRSLGAVPMDEWTVYRVSGASLTQLTGEETDQSQSQNWEELS
jgi:GNAT superfamily N-acetyltransferase